MNIEFHGFNPDVHEPLRWVVWEKLNEYLPFKKTLDCVVTIDKSESWGKNQRQEPFVRVFSSDQTDLDLVCGLILLLNLPGLGKGTCVEFILLTSFRQL